MKLPFTSNRSGAILLVDQGDPTPRFLVATYDQKQLQVLLKGNLVPDSESTVAAQLRNRLEEAGIQCTQAVLLLSRPAVEFFSGSMPPAEPHELPTLVENFVYQETDDADDRVIDFIVTGGDHETTSDVLAMTCDKTVLETAVREFKEAGFKLQAATYNGFGAIQLIHQVAHQKLPITIAITSSDASTEIAVLQNRQPVLFRTILRGVEPGDSFASALAAEVQRTLAFIGAGDEDSALIYLMGRQEDLSEVAQVMSDTVSSSVTIAGVLDRVDDSRIEAFDDAASFAQLIGVGFAIHQDRLTANFLVPRKAPTAETPWRRIATFGSLAAIVLGVFGYIGWTERAEQLGVIGERQKSYKNLEKRVNQSAELQDIVDAVALWQSNDITWLDELKDLSDRFPERNQSLVRKMKLSAADNGAGVVDLSVQVNSPEVITELESAIRDDRHSVSSKRVTEVSDAEELTWAFETRIVFRPLPRPKQTLPEPIEEVTVDGKDIGELAAGELEAGNVEAGELEAGEGAQQDSQSEESRIPEPPEPKPDGSADAGAAPGRPSEVQSSAEQPGSDVESNNTGDARDTEDRP